MKSQAPNQRPDIADAEDTASSPNCGNALLPAALMMPRVKQIINYPRQGHEKGHIYQKDETDEGWSNSEWLEWYQLYPEVFRIMEWWEERKVEEMPEYIKYIRFDNNEKKVINATDWRIEKDGKYTFKSDNEFFSLSVNDEDLPATESEYLSYIEGLKK